MSFRFRFQPQHWGSGSSRSTWPSRTRVFDSRRSHRHAPESVLASVNMLQCKIVNVPDENVCSSVIQERMWGDICPDHQGHKDPQDHQEHQLEFQPVTVWMKSLHTSSISWTVSTRLYKTTVSVKVKPVSNPSNCLLQVEGLLEVHLDHQVLLVPLLREGLPLPLQRLTIMSWAEVISTDWQKRTFSNHRREEWRLVCVRLRSRVPRMGQLCHSARSPWAAWCSRATWTPRASGATGRVCHCVWGGKPWLQSGGHSALPAEWACANLLVTFIPRSWFIIHHHFQAQDSEAFLANLVPKVHPDHKVLLEATAQHWPTLGRKSGPRFRIICSVRLCCGTSDQTASPPL